MHFYITARFDSLRSRLVLRDPIVFIRIAAVLIGPSLEIPGACCGLGRTLADSRSHRAFLDFLFYTLVTFQKKKEK